MGDEGVGVGLVWGLGLRVYIWRWGGPTCQKYPTSPQQSYVYSCFIVLFLSWPTRPKKTWNLKMSFCKLLFVLTGAGMGLHVSWRGLTALA